MPPASAGRRPSHTRIPWDLLASVSRSFNRSRVRELLPAPFVIALTLLATGCASSQPGFAPGAGEVLDASARTASHASESLPGASPSDAPASASGADASQELSGRPAKGGASSAGSPRPLPAIARDEPDSPRAAQETPPAEDATPAPAPIPATPSATSRRLLDQIVARDGQRLHDELSTLLDSGPEGLAEIDAFLHFADIDRQKILDLTHEPLLLHALLRIAARRPDDVARATRYLLRATQDRLDSFVRREIFNFAPVLINFHPGRYPELRSALKREIDRQIEHKGAWLYKVLLAIRDLDLSPPPELFHPLLVDREQVDAHSLAIEYLASRGEPGARMLVQFAAEVGASYPSAPHALRAVSLAGRDGARAWLEPVLKSTSPELRSTAIQAYFEFRRGFGDVDLALEFLNSTVALSRKNALLRSIRQRSFETLEALGDQLELVEDESLRAVVETVVQQEMARDRAKKARAKESSTP